MKDEKFFIDLVRNSILWALFGLLLLVLLTMVAAPLALALFVDWRWIFLYVGYLVAFVMSVCVISAGKEADKNDENH